MPGMNGRQLAGKPKELVGARPGWPMCHLHERLHRRLGDSALEAFSRRPSYWCRNLSLRIVLLTRIRQVAHRLLKNLFSAACVPLRGQSEGCTLPERFVADVERRRDELMS